MKNIKPVIQTNFLSVIPQTCKYKGAKFECGLSVSCILGGGRPVDLCSGGLIWSCCVDDDDIPEKVPRPSMGLLQNASKYHQENIPIGIASIAKRDRVGKLEENLTRRFPNMIFGLSRSSR